MAFEANMSLDAITNAPTHIFDEFGSVWTRTTPPMKAGVRLDLSGFASNAISRRNITCTTMLPPIYVEHTSAHGSEDGKRKGRRVRVELARRAVTGPRSTGSRTTAG